MIIAIANQKGGAGKSTTAASMAAALTAKKRKILIVDMDAQGNTTDTCAAVVNGETPTAFDILSKRTPAIEAIQQTSHGDIIPSSLELATMDNVLTATGKEYRLQKALAPVLDKYDFVIVDTPPALGVLTINALTAATGIIIPTNADKYGLQGIMQLYGQIESVQEYTNPKLEIYGILLTRHTPRQTVLSDFAEGFKETAKQIKTSVFNTYIRECAAIRKAQATRQSIYQFDPKCAGAVDYANFVEEFLTFVKGKGKHHE
jgi:chromosome partitioning protein